MASAKTIDQKMFSIIMATYNCGQKVEGTLQSIFSQNKELYELIVVDSASSDNTLEYIKKYKNDLTLISEKDAGVYDAFNKGIERAVGKYIYFIGAGDRLRPNILEQIREFLPESPPAFVYGNFYLMKQQIFGGREFCSANFITDNICHQAIFYHRDIFDLLGKYDIRYKVFSDWIFNLKCFTHKGISKQYVRCLIADFEEGGLSSKLNNDPAFKKDFPHLVKRYLGTRSYFFSHAFMTSPSLYSFSYNVWHTFLESLRNLAKRCFYGCK